MTRSVPPTAATEPAATNAHIVFIDRAVSGHAALAAALPAGTETIYIDSEQDGFAQLAAALEGRSGIASVGIVSHGAAGTLSLGSTQLTVDTIGGFMTQLSEIRDALAPGADLLLYGCDIAASDDGRALVEALAAATGADVAASLDRSSNAALGGNWVLEYHTGAIDAANLVPQSALAALDGALDAASRAYVRIAPAPYPEFVTGTSSTALVADFDGDGDMDLIRQTGWGAASAGVLFVNDNGVLTESATTIAELVDANLAAVRLVDFDGDGDVDIYLPLQGSRADIYLVNDRGTFSSATPPVPEYTLASNTTLCLVGDLDGDGDEDLLRQDNGPGSAPVFYENVGGTFVQSTKVTFPAAPGASLDLGKLVDFDGDGLLDYYQPVENQNGDTAIVNDIYLRNDGSAFTVAPNPVPEFTGASLANLFLAGDFDGDGDLDLLVQKDGIAAQALFYENVGGAFAASTKITVPLTASLNLSQFRAVDFDGDGDLDLYAQRSSTNNDIYLEMPGAAPTLTGSSVTDGATPVAPDADIVLRFSEPVFAGAGNIYIHRASDGAVVATIAATGAAVSGSGTSEITIDPAANLTENATFYLTFDTHAFADADGMVFGKLDFTTLVRVGQDDPELVRFSTGAANAAPTLTGMSALAGGIEDTVKSVSFSDLRAAGNESDSDGSVTAFVVRAVSSGVLKIGLDPASATAWAAGSNDVIDATHLAFWTPAADANGFGATALDAFTVVARDDGGAVSATPVQVKVNVSAVNDQPTLARDTGLTAIQEDTATNPGDRVGDLILASGYADVDASDTGPTSVVISADGADPVTEGRWEYSSDGGQHWHEIGSVSPRAALMLGASAHVRFVPVAGYAGTPGALTVYATDASMTGMSSRWNGLTETRVTVDTTTAGATSPQSTSSVNWTIAVDAVNDAPLISNLDHGDDQTWIAGSAPILVDLGANAVVADSDNANFAGGTLSMRISAGRNPEDTLGLQGGASTAALSSFAPGSAITIDGKVIGTVADSARSYSVTIDLNADATPAAIATLLRHLTFSTTGYDGTRTVRVNLGDGAGGYSSNADVDISVVSSPSLSISSNLQTVKTGQQATLTLTFSAAPTGFELDDLTVAGGTVDNLQATGDARVYTATFTPSADTQDLQAAISIGAGKFSANGKENIASAAPTLITGDTLAPGVSISASKNSLKAGESATITFTFTEAPANLAGGDISFSGGNLTNLHAVSQDNKTWQATFTPTGGLASVEGSVSLAAGVYRDTAGNDGTASNVVNISADTEKPAVNAGAFTVSGATGANDTFRIGDTITVTWTGEANVDIALVAFDLRDFGGSDSVTATWVDGKWTASLPVGASGFDDTNAYVAVTVVDNAGNDTWIVVRDDISLDSRVPFVRDAAIALSGTPTGADGSYRIGDTVTATWTPGVVTTDTASVAMDFSQFGGALEVAATLVDGKWTASYTIVAATLPDGPRNVKVTATDDVGNTDSAFDASNPAIDAARPTVSAIAIVGTPAPDASSVQFLVTLSEAVTGLGQDDFVLHLADGATATIASIAGSGDAYTVTVSDIAGNGSLRLDLKAGATGIADLAGNAIADGGYTGGATHTASFNAAPAIVSNQGLEQATVKVAEGRTAVTTVQASDADQDALVYSIEGGVDAGLFAIDAATGALTFKQAPVLATGANADNGYEVRVGVSDGKGGSDSQLLNVVVDEDIDDDGRPDSEQANIGSIQTVGAGNPVATLAVADGFTLSGLGASAAPTAGLPRGVKLPLGQLDFTIGNVALGGTVEMAIYVDAGLKINAYYKQDNSGAWKNIAKSVTTVGAKTKVTFDLTDGGPLDSDREVNGSISDPGGLAIITPQITSDGGATVAAVRMEENSVAVTTVAATALGSVTYAIAGGADADLFLIDAATGALRFKAAPDYENPRDAGDGAKNNTYVVEVMASDASGSETQTLTVTVTDVDETSPQPPRPTPPAPGSATVDGVKVMTGTKQNGDGSTSQVITIPVVQPDRVDSVGDSAVADIPLAQYQGKDILAVQLPTGFGLQVEGLAAPSTAGQSLADLVREIEAHTPAGSADRASLVDGGAGYLGGLEAGMPLLVRSITPTTGGTAVGEPLVIMGQPAAPGGVRTALVIDGSGLAAGTHLQLKDIDFAAIVGAVHVSGGDGAQQLWGDSADQVLMLGAGDDTVHGGGGNDHIDGGSGIDTVLLTGGARADYSLRMKDGMLVATALTGADGIDTIVDVEIMQFGTPDTSAAGTIGRLYEAALGRAADTAGREFWVGQHAAGISMQDIAAAIVGSNEALEQQHGDAGYVEQLYESLLGRASDAEGAAFWVGQLEQGAVTRAGLALAFADSAEKLAMPSSAQMDFNHSDVATLVRMYEALFDRAPDEGGLNFWIAMHESGVTMRALAQGFLASSESAAHYAALDDAHFVAALYQTALGHGPSEAEAAQWSAMLAGGQTTRADVLLGIADSDEMIQLVGTINTSIETI
ncbi:DUF4347 domain-containing protein [Telluria beijingensis]|uniref:DUF4347 domain-containing protein n=1 Tax=Telluria beijingensis TaxID=3068633 RepID=UPI0027953077|nr:DUF4347 domain-containing protein [Massilia sp. REN29]